MTAEVKADPPHGITITIHEFNWMVRQEFDGYLFRASRDGIAGSTYWAGDRQPFGFLARKTASLVLGRFPGAGEPVRPEDFGGRYAVFDDGRPGVLSLLPILKGVSGAVSGWRAPTGPRGQRPRRRNCGTRGRAGDRGALGGRRRKFVGYLFSKTKNAIAGWTEAGDIAAGFYMTKLSSPSDARSARSPGA